MTGVTAHVRGICSDAHTGRTLSLKVFFVLDFCIQGFITPHPFFFLSFFFSVNPFLVLTNCTSSIISCSAVCGGNTAEIMSNCAIG